MSLLLQIRSILFSFIYGIFFVFTFNLNKKCFLDKNKIFSFIISFLFIINHVLIYFLCIRLINNAILNIYFLFSFLLGILFYTLLFKKLTNYYS